MSKNVVITTLIMNTILIIFCILVLCTLFIWVFPLMMK